MRLLLLSLAEIWSIYINDSDTVSYYVGLGGN
jgi:hypothetical protein